MTLGNLLNGNILPNSRYDYGGTNRGYRSMVYFPGAASVALFSKIIIDPLRPDAESDVAMLHRVVTFLTKVASQEQDTYLDYVLALCSDFENAARKEIHQARAPRPDSSRTTGPNVARAQAQMPQSDLNQTNVAAEINHDQLNHGPATQIPYWNMSVPDQSLHPSGQLPLPGPLSWNWQDMVAGIPPAFDFGAYDFSAPLEDL